MSRRVLALLVAGGLAVALAVAVVAAPWASSEPDGLERVATDEGIAAEQDAHALAASPAADYAAAPWRAAGVVLVFALGAGLTAVVRTRRRGDPALG